MDGGYYFGIGGENENNYPQNLYLKSSNITLLENVNYLLEKSTDSSAYGGGGGVSDVNNYNTSYTSENFTGELTITKLDVQEYIVSGTFEMDLPDPFTGDTIKIRKGRFDTLFIP
ncbi:hypothetical protein ACFQ3R_12265 [Mesonia ostreae]|uniref:Uncharacterized protein n=1 Tax=Mesonia ostreae TaxID=861110 RepID=A0ABU2KIJ7_9FLAO|nr:hypothetical protein [Mesonia ostreae]MDT0294542.1 hypothetical protein [Mesonia ostreae]